MSNLQIDSDQLRGSMSEAKAAELGIVTKPELTTMQTDITALIEQRERGYQLIGVALVAYDQNFDLSTTTTNTIDGIVIPEEGSVFFYKQADPKENGVYQWKNSAWVRDPRFDEGVEIKLGNFFLVDQGSHLGKRLVVTSKGSGKKGAHVIGSDPVTIEAKTLGMPVITPLKESGQTTKDVLDTTNAGAEATGFVLAQDYSHIIQVYLGVSPLLVGQTTSSMAFFSSDNGATAKLPGNFKTGDELFVDASLTKVAFPTGKLVQLTGFKGETAYLGGTQLVDYGVEQAIPGATYKGKQVYTRVIEYSDHTQVKLPGIDALITGQPNTHPTTDEFWMTAVDYEPGKPGSYYLMTVPSSGTDLHYIKRTITTENDSFQLVQPDPINRHLYYCKNGSSDLFRSNLDGSEERVIISNVHANPINFALDLENGYIYVAPSNSSSDPMKRYNLDGSGETTIKSNLGQVNLGIRLYKGKLYYHNASQGRMERMDVDGSNLEMVVDHPTPFRGFDVRDDKLYAVYNARLYVHALDGTLINDLGPFENITAPFFVTDTHIYWYLGYLLKRAKIDNTDKVTLLNVAPDPAFRNLSGSHYPVKFIPPNLSAYKNLQNEVIITGDTLGKAYAGNFKPEYTKI